MGLLTQEDQQYYREMALSYQKKHLMTYEQMSEYVGISTDYYRRLVKGKYNVSIKVAKKIDEKCKEVI